MATSSVSWGALGMRIGAICAVSLALIFAVSGIAKLRQPDAFAKSLATFGWIRPSYARVLGRTLPGIEVLTAAIVVLPATRLAGSLMALGLLVVLTTVLLAALAQGRQVDCGCFGGRPDVRSPVIGIIRNGLLIGIASGAIAFRTSADFNGPAILSGVALGFLVLLVFEAATIMTRIGARPEGMRYSA